MRKLGVVLMLAAVIGFSAEVTAQDFAWEIDAGNVEQSDLDKQVKSLLNLFSSLAGSGFINTAALHSVGGVDVRLSGIFTPIPDEFKDIIPTVQDPLEGVDYVPFAMFHGNIGLPANLEVYGRFFTLPLKGDPGGNVTLLGGGLKYGLLRGNLASPDITIMGGYQTILVPDQYNFGSVSTLSLKAYISKDFALLTLYGGAGIDRTALSLNVPGLPPDINKDYDTVYPQGTVGLAFKLLPLLRVNIDANFGDYTAVGLGAGLSFR